MAKLDPMGNCTDGVVRVMSPLTQNASDDNGVKGLSYWNRSKYFNVWVVDDIDAGGDAIGGIILGYAQLPFFGAANTDGVVVRSDYIGTIGTGLLNGSLGRTLTHEVGHWFGLLHTFQGGCAGGFFGESIDDTPPQAQATPSNCPQNANTCSNDNPDLPDMVENYMDYSRGSCQNTFTLGQKDAMNDALSSSPRSGLYSQSNLDDTGVLLGETPCAPKAQFYAEQRIVCVGEPVTFTDGAFNGEVDTYTWDLPGATPSSSGSAEPTVTYSMPGTYSVTQTVFNSQGSDSETQTDYITVIPADAEINSWIGFEGFENAQPEYIVSSDGLGNTWEETTSASYSGNKSLVLRNHSGNPIDSEDEFLLKSVDLTQMNEPDLYFRLAYKQRSGQSDRLRVFVSDNCGENWALRYNRSGSSLATVSGAQSSSFTPSSESDWELIDVNLSSYDDEEHVLIKFQGTSDEGNNIYIDDIQISGPLGVSQELQDFNFTVAPNPMNGVSVISLETKESANYIVRVTDVAGRSVMDLHNGNLTTGTHRFEIERSMLPSAGVYLIQTETETGRSVKKLLVQ